MGGRAETEIKNIERIKRRKEQNEGESENAN